MVLSASPSASSVPRRPWWTSPRAPLLPTMTQSAPSSLRPRPRTKARTSACQWRSKARASEESCRHHPVTVASTIAARCRHFRHRHRALPLPPPPEDDRPRRRRTPRPSPSPPSFAIFSHHGRRRRGGSSSRDRSLLLTTARGGAGGGCHPRSHRRSHRPRWTRRPSRCCRRRRPSPRPHWSPPPLGGTVCQ